MTLRPAPELDYAKLGRPQKLAAFLIVIGPEAAADVLRHFDDAVVEMLCREMATFGIIPPAIQKQLLEEFSALVAQSAGSALGGITYAQRTLELAKGDHKAAAIIDRVGPTGTSAEVIQDIAEMDAHQIFNLVKNEQPQTLAFLLSYLDSARSAEIFALLGPEMRDEVMERLGTIESTSVDLVAKIVKNLGKHYDTKARPALHHSGGVRAVAELLNQLDKETSKNLLSRLEERNGALCAAVRKKLFSFEDLSRLQPSDLQRVLREVESTTLATAMKAASEGLRTLIFAAISKRAAESLRDEMEMLGSVRAKDVEAAQDAAIAVVRRLEEEGQISLDPQGAGDVFS